MDFSVVPIPSLFDGLPFLMFPIWVQNGWWLLPILVMMAASVYAAYHFYKRSVDLERQLAKANKGFIDVKQLGAQSIRNVAKATIPSERLYSEEASSYGIPHVLLIESDTEKLSVLVNSLSEHYRVNAFLNAREGLGMALEAVPDLIITALELPDMNGFEVCQILKVSSLTAHIPILALSSYSESDDGYLALQKGADTCLNWPINKNELLLRVKKLLDLTELLRHKYRPGISKSPIGEMPDYDQIFLERLHQVIDKHLADENFSTIQLSEEMGMSRTQLHRKMTELLGQPAGEYIKNYKLDQAYAFLKGSQVKVQDVMEKVGYSKMSYFIAQFKKKHGILPSKLREGTPMSLL